MVNLCDLLKEELVSCSVWRRSSYARVLIEINASNDFSDNLVMVVPNLEGNGYTKETINIEYEWETPRWGDDEEFIKVKCRKSSGNNGDKKHFKSVSVKLKTQYQPKAKQSTAWTTSYAVLFGNTGLTPWNERSDDLCLAFALGVGTPWRHRSLIPGIVMLHRVPFSTLLLAVLGPFSCAHSLSELPIWLTRLTLFELYCRSLHIVLSVNLFRVFYKIGKQGDWFTFEKRVGPGSGGKILNETFSGLKGWKKRFFFLDRRAIPQAMAWRHHDSDIHDPLPTDGFHASDVVTLTNQSIDIRPVPSGLLFHAGLATTWEFSGFLPIFKDTEGNVVTMSEYLRFPFLDGATIEQGDALSARDVITQRTTSPLPVNQSLPEKTARLKEVEIPDPKIVAIRERKARAAAKKRAERKKDAVVGGVKVVSKGEAKRGVMLMKLTVLPSCFLVLQIHEWNILKKIRVDTPEECRELLTHLAPPAALVEALGLTFPMCLIDTTIFVQTDISKSEEKLLVARPLTLKKLEAELARKDSALVFSDRVSNERAVENERLVSKLGYLEKEKTDSIGKLLPTVVRRLLNSHEYKESLSIPFNLAIQAGWAKGLAVKRSEEDLMDVLREEKIFGLPRRTVQELLKMYPAPPPQDAPTKVNPSSQAPDSSKSVPPRG
ncbi:hypothetical protein Tco_0162789 [Tanacetum coccineum]